MQRLVSRNADTASDLRIPTAQGWRRWRTNVLLLTLAMLEVATPEAERLGKSCGDVKTRVLAMALNLAV